MEQKVSIVRQRKFQQRNHCFKASRNYAVLTGKQFSSKKPVVLLCINIDSHLAGTYKHGLLPKINDHGFRGYDVVFYQQIGAETFYKVDLTLERGVDQVSNTIFIQEV